MSSRSSFEEWFQFLDNLQDLMLLLRIPDIYMVAVNDHFLAIHPELQEIAAAGRELLTDLVPVHGFVKIYPADECVLFTAGPGIGNVEFHDNL